MKKMTALFFSFVILLCMSYKPNVKTVFIEQKNNALLSTFSTYEIEIGGRITTNDFLEYFKNVEVQSITPYMESPYQKIIEKEIGSFSFTSDSIQNNLYHFTKEYEKVMQSHGLKKDLVNHYIRGIPLENVEIFATKKQYQKIKEHIDKI